MNPQHRAIGKLLIRIPLSLESPLIIGSGESEHSDVDVLRDPVSGSPLIPATSMIGVFRAYLENGLREELAAGGSRRDNFIFLFGDRRAEIAQSALQCDDILLAGARVVIRDGVAIDAQTNTAADQMKFNYQIVEPPGIFMLLLEMTLRPCFEVSILRRLLWTIFTAIARGEIRLGAKTNKGFGRLAVDLNAIQVAELDFTRRHHVWQWLSGEYEFAPAAPADRQVYEISHREFVIDALFQIKNSLLIKSYSPDPAAPDAVALGRSSSNSGSSSGTNTETQVPLPTASATAPVLPGTSVMGAVRHRAGKILKTLGLPEPVLEAALAGLFGFVSERPATPSARKGRVRAEETWLRNVRAEMQTRIRLDRFTGGTWPGALFETMPLWPDGDGGAVRIVLSIRDCHAWEAGLFLYILKDLWTGDLPLGGEKSIGRGVLAGVSAKIVWDQHKVNLRADPAGGLVDDPAAWTLLEAVAEAVAVKAALPF